MRMETLAEKFANLEDKINAFDPTSIDFALTTKGPDTDTSTPSYAQVAATDPTNSVHQLLKSKHTAAIQAGHMNDRKFVVRTEDNTNTDTTEQILLQKAMHALAELLQSEEEEKGSRQIVAVQKVWGGGVMCIMRTKDDMQWLKQGDRLKRFCNWWGAPASAKPNLYSVLVRFVPVTATIGPETYNRTEISSQLEHGTIAAIEWAKKMEKRTPHQKTAHAIVSFTTREAANQVIQKGMTIGGKWVHGHRDQKDPQRCMKCQVFGHIAKECRAGNDVCGRCKDNHRTADCMATEEGFYCANCKQQGHIASDRKCPTLMRKIKERTQRNPETGYRFFVTDHPDTWTREDESGDGYNKDWRVKVQRGYNKNMTIVPEGGGRGRLTTQHETVPHIGTQRATQLQPQHDQTNGEKQRPRTIDSYGWTSYSRHRNTSHSREPIHNYHDNSDHTRGEDIHPYGSQ